MVSSRNLEELPTEILGSIFSKVHDPRTIRNARLASRRVKDIASAFLIRKINVHLTSQSLADLEQLCSHDVYSKSIRKVTIDISYYDAVLANDLDLFADHCHSSLYRHLELLERGMSYRRRYLDKDERTAAEHQARIQKLWKLINSNEITTVVDANGGGKNPTPVQQLIRTFHRTYQERYDDQQSVRRDNQHINRICVALQKLPALERLAIEDVYVGRSVKKATIIDYPALGLEHKFLKHFDWALYPSNWCGSFTTAYVTQPPTEMLGELLSRLGQSDIRPRSIGISACAPANLKCLALSEEQAIGVRDLVSRATKLNVLVDRWARKGSLAENNDRNREEMLAVCSLTQPFFDAPQLKRLRLFFLNFPAFHQIPTISLADLLPLGKKSWHQLRVAYLSHIPVTIAELRAFVEMQKDTVRDFTWESGWLLQGGWDEAYDAMRGLRLLEKISLRFPVGERYGVRGGTGPGISYEDIYNFILRRTDVNPLPPWNGTAS